MVEISGSTKKNVNIKLLSDLIFKLCLGYHLLKIGIRRCRIEYVMSGKKLISPLIYWNNHPMYRKLLCYMDFDWANMPDIVWFQVANTVGLKLLGKGCESDKDSALEHIDFNVEYVNKDLKQNLLWAPTQKVWVTACRTYDLL